jgi:hypothetical protein
MLYSGNDFAAEQRFRSLLCHKSLAERPVSDRPEADGVRLTLQRDEAMQDCD